MKTILLFAEREFREATSQPTIELARAYCDGAVRGASFYGMGSFGTYVMPDDEEDMREMESAEEIERALRAPLERP